MENATKALIIAGGILIAIIIISVAIIAFQKTGNISRTYRTTINEEDIATFNVNFTQYVGKQFSIQQAISITNFAKENNVEVIGKVTVDAINGDTIERKYQINVLSYDEDGYISKIKLY